MRKQLAVLLTGIFIVFMAVVVSAPLTGRAFAAAQTKDIRVEGKAGELKVDFKPVKKSYKVDEPISFKAKANKDAYIYVFSVSSDSGNSVQIFPNKFDKDNHLKADKAVTLPSKSDFMSDRSGEERIIVVASRTKLNFQTKEITNSKFFEVDKNSYESTVKDIRVSPKKEESGLVKEITVKIKGK